MKHFDHRVETDQSPPSLPFNLNDADVINALHALVDCPFSFRTRTTSAGLMISNAKLAANESICESVKLINGMYAFSKDGTVPIPKPGIEARTNSSYSGMTLPTGRYLQHYPQYFPPEPVHSIPKELAGIEDPQGPTKPAGTPVPNTPPPMPPPDDKTKSVPPQMEQESQYNLPDTAPYRKPTKVETSEGTSKPSGTRDPISPPMSTPNEETKVQPPSQADEDPPSDQEILRAMPRVVRGVPFVYDQFREDIVFVKNRIVDKLDPPRFFPLVGPAQLHHCHWECAIYYTETIQTDYPFTCYTKKLRVQVVYIDKDHLHLCVGPNPEDQR
jgi:hypothetical protein